jgi:crossover junction endodeoxyribonuclease RuvC
VIVLGIDPGSIKTGFGVVSVEKRRMVPVEFGVIRTKPGEEMPARLCRIFEGIVDVIDRHKPGEAAIEKVFHGTRAQNFDSTLKLGQARRVALLALARAGIPLGEYAPADVKKSITGTGRAEKWQMQKMMETLLHLDKAPAEDAADALALALCHAFRKGLI